VSSVKSVCYKRVISNIILTLIFKYKTEWLLETQITQMTQIFADLSHELYQFYFKNYYIILCAYVLKTKKIDFPIVQNTNSILYIINRRFIAFK